MYPGLKELIRLALLSAVITITAIMVLKPDAYAINYQDFDETYVIIIDNENPGTTNASNADPYHYWSQQEADALPFDAWKTLIIRDHRGFSRMMIYELAPGLANIYYSNSSHVTVTWYDWDRDPIDIDWRDTCMRTYARTLMLPQPRLIR